MGDDLLPRGTVVRIEMEVALPCAATEAQVREWVNHEAYIAGISLENPLAMFDMDAVHQPITEILRQERTGG